MIITFGEFTAGVFSDPPFLITVILTLCVVLVNGWTDAPNAIATAVSTRSIGPRSAVALAAVFNFLGVSVMTSVNARIAITISGIANFGTSTDSVSEYATTALCAALFAIIVWSVAAWRFGIPTSESHALIAGLSGAAIALNGSFSGININEWLKVIYGLVLSTAIGFAMGWFTAKAVELAANSAIKITGTFNRPKVNRFFEKAQIFGAASTAFMHGAQDGQKFIGVFILGMMLSKNLPVESRELQIPIWLMIICSSVMAIGTLIGGGRIIKSVGMDMVRLKKYQGFASDTAASLCLLISSLFGIPVSTTHTKTTAIMGVGAAKRISSVNWSVAKEMVLTWVLTFPGCGIIGYAAAKLFMLVF